MITENDRQSCDRMKSRVEESSSLTTAEKERLQSLLEQQIEATNGYTQEEKIKRIAENDFAFGKIFAEMYMKNADRDVHMSGLEDRMKNLELRVEKVETKVDGIESSLASIGKDIREGFISVNERLDKLENRNENTEIEENATKAERKRWVNAVIWILSVGIVGTAMWFWGPEVASLIVSILPFSL